MRSFASHDAGEDARFERPTVEDIEPLPESDLTRLADGLSAVLVWLSEKRNTRNPHGPDTRRYFCASKSDLRVMAFLYCVRPDLVENSLRAVARRVGCSPEAIRKHVDDFRRCFGYRTPGQWSQEARAELRASALERHRKAA